MQRGEGRVGSAGGGGCSPIGRAQRPQNTWGGGVRANRWYLDTMPRGLPSAQICASLHTLEEAAAATVRHTSMQFSHLLHRPSARPPARPPTRQPCEESLQASRQEDARAAPRNDLLRARDAAPRPRPTIPCPREHEGTAKGGATTSAPRPLPRRS